MGPEVELQDGAKCAGPPTGQEGVVGGDSCNSVARDEWEGGPASGDGFGLDGKYTFPQLVLSEFGRGSNEIGKDVDEENFVQAVVN